jgi:hypothetical protein
MTCRTVIYFAMVGRLQFVFIDHSQCTPGCPERQCLSYRTLLEKNSGHSGTGHLYSSGKSTIEQM